MREDLPFNMADVAGLVGLQIKRRGSISWEAYCPFCQDEKGKMNLNLKKNVFRCNRCGESGECWTCMGNCTMWIMEQPAVRLKNYWEGRLRKNHIRYRQKKVEQKIPEIPQAEAGRNRSV